VRLAYLCNLYPAVSHSFVRREIEAVERAGHAVHRFSIRRPRSDLKDPADQREAGITEVVLGQGIGLLLAVLALLVSRPIATLRALDTARRLSGPGVRQKIRHIAYWLEAAWLVRRLAKLGVEHLHAHFGTNPAAVAAIVTAWNGPTFSFTAHGPDEFDAPAALSLGAKIEAASFVAAISSYGRSQLMRWSAPDHWPRIEVVRCGLGRDFLDVEAAPLDSASTELLCIARLSAQKGLPLLVAACDLLRDRGDRFTLTIVGDGELRGMLTEEIERRSLGEIVTLAGVRSAAEIREHLNRCRAFVLPSFAEGLPVVIMEAFALDRPVICTAVAGIPELVDDSCGWLIPAGSVEALADAMSAALHTTVGELAAKAAVGRERIKRMHDVDRNAATLLAAIEASSRSDTR